MAPAAKTFLYQRRSEKTGLPPGTPVHIGQKKTDRVSIRLINYNEDHVEERFIEDIRECQVSSKESTIRWVDVIGLHDMDILKRVGDCFGLHPLVREDIVNTGQRPKIEDYGDYLYVVFKMLVSQAAGKVAVEQVSIVLGKDFVISFQEREGDIFDPIRERIRSGKGLIRKEGSDFLVYSLLDIAVDHYFSVTEGLGDEIETISEKALANPGPDIMASIHNLRREMMFLHRAVWPLREVVSGFSRNDSNLVSDGTGIYLRDLYDHTIQVMDAVEIYREMMSDLADIYLSSVSNRLNTVMKVLTIISTIFIPLTFLAGVYGMNFKHFPEIGWPWGYPLFWAVCIIVAATMLMVFKRKKWL